MHCVTRLWLICLGLLFVVGLQAQTGSISGTVTDSSGGVIPGARVTATNTDTGASRSVDTSATGTFALTNLSVGKYTLSVEAKGFSVAKYSDLVLTVAQALSVNPLLEPGKVNETVEVSGSTLAPIELENAQLSNIVDSKRIVDLPLVTRDPYSLVLLSPGTVQSNTSSGGFSVNGARERNNNFLLDGVDNNDTSVPGAPFGISALTPDATQEFRVITNSFQPEFGRNSGAIIDIVTKSGTNDLHGGAYWFGRYNALGARDFFNTKDNPQDPYVRNIFGFNAGGPIKKDKTFFFVNSEWQRFRTTLTNTSVVPTAAFKTGIFTFQGFKVNLADPNSPNNAQGLPLDPTVQKLLGLLPDPNGEAVDDVRGLYRFPSSEAFDSANVTFKVDHRISEKHSFFLRYVYGGVNDNNVEHQEILPGLGGIGTNQQTQNIAANLTSTFRPTLVNEFHAGVNRVDAPFDCVNRGFDRFSKPDAFGAATDYSISGIVGIGCQPLFDSNGQNRRTGTWTLSDSLTWVKGRHTVKFGGDVRLIYENGFNAFGTRPSVSFDAFTTFNAPIVNLNPNRPCDPNTGANCGGTQIQNMASGLLGLVDIISQSQYFDQSGTRQPADFRDFRWHEYDVFAQDSWKLLPNLTIDFGMRYQYNSVPWESNNNLSALFADPAGTAPFTFSIVGPGTGHPLFNNDALNFEPRFGFAWDPFKRGKTSIRGGYGIFHDRIFGNLINNSSTNPPFQQSFQDFPGDILPNVPTPAVQKPTKTINEGDFLSGASIYDKDFKVPASQNWNFGVQQEVWKDVTVEVNYVGTHGTRESRVVDGNPPQPALVNQLLAKGASPASLQFTALYLGGAVNNTAFFQPAVVKTIGNSTYQGLQSKVTKRFSHGLQIQGAYTWSHAIDDASDPLVAAAGNRSFPRNSLNLHEERGDSDFDIRHRLALNYIYELPFGKGRQFANHGVVGRVLEGWDVSGISAFQSGHPYDVFGNRDSEHAGLSSRGDIVGSLAIPSGSERNRTGPLGTSFALAPFGRSGNYGRNSLTGPGTINTDFLLSKKTAITERLKTDLRFEFYNLFNRTEFVQPGNAIANPATFGLSTGTLTRADGTTSNRQIQLALKLLF